MWVVNTHFKVGGESVHLQKKAETPADAVKLFLELWAKVDGSVRDAVDHIQIDLRTEERLETDKKRGKPSSLILPERFN
jgi:hypothetical protein